MKNGLISWYRQTNKLFMWGFVIVFVLTFGVYLKTMAPTVSFWDCGEFIACSYILGIPHPPGTPLFILIGRLFSLVPLFDQVAERVNFISVLSTALACGVGYLIVLRILGYIGLSRFFRFVGGVMGGLFIGFSNTVWSNAVEAEVYGLSTLMMLSIIYIGLMWRDNRGGERGDRLLILMGYLSFLSIGVHMSTFLVVPALFLWVLLEDRSKLRDIRFWITGLVLSLVMFALVPFLVGVLMWVVVAGYNYLIAGSKRWALLFLLSVTALAGYSVHAYIPIRSAQNPAIDENDPRDWGSFKYFLERKQYGNESMVSRAMKRRGEWINQFGAHERMGMWGFFRNQYMKQELWVIPMLIGLWGLYSLIKKSRKIGVLFLVLFLIGTVGLVVYMNFSDGTKGDHIEVRDRDYFFTPGFVFFALLMGMGGGMILNYLKERMEKKGLGEIVRRSIYGLGIVFVFLPFLALGEYYHTHSRAGNYIPYDYAYNLLMSVDRDAIMFTNGDNDTFPLWFLQEVEGIRKDVRVVNLSLINTDWYILQLKNHMGVPITLSEKQVRWKVELPGGGKRPKEPYYDPLRKVSHYLFPVFDEQAGRIIRIQDQMIEHIILTNQWRYPIYFSGTVPSENRVKLDQYLRGEGFGLRLVPDKVGSSLEPEITWRYLTTIYQYRGLADPNVYKDETATGLLLNYAERFNDLAAYYERAGAREKEIEVLKKSVSIYPEYWRSYVVLAQLYDIQGQKEEKTKILSQGERYLKMMSEKYPENYLFTQYFGLILQFNGKADQAIEALKEAYRASPSSDFTYKVLLSVYLQNNRIEPGIELMQEWLSRHPDDQSTQNLLSAYTQRTQPQTKP